MSKKALVIDGNSLIYRAYYATLNQLAYYKQNNLQPVNALKLVSLIVLKILQSENFDYVLMALDHQKKTLRHDVYVDYKANRKPTPEELASQLPLIKETMPILGVNILSIPGIEADDIIGTFSKLMNQNDVEVCIYSSDKDMLQLINNKTFVKLFKTGISETCLVNAENFHQHFFGLKPEQVIDFKGISGDSSDNLKGVSGIGPKTAVTLITQYGSLEKIYENIHLLNINQQKKFIDSKETAVLCKKLSTIETNIEINNDLNAYLRHPINKALFKEFIDKYHFHSLEKYLSD
jgi:DNA polymerase-1